MPETSSSKSTSGRSDEFDAQSERIHRKLQRILRPGDQLQDTRSGGRGVVGPRMDEVTKEATLSPRLLNPTQAPEDDGPLFQCTECDMIVKESDPYCPFCGAIFADGAQPEQPFQASKPGPTPSVAPVVERPVHREPFVRPEKFDLFSLIKPGTRSKELLYREAMQGFPGSVRLLEEIERLVSDLSSLGLDMTKARRLISSAWEAARDGNWNLVTTLAHQTEQEVSPSIPDLVRSEISRARGYLTEAKAMGIDISSYVLKIKNAVQSLNSGDSDEALRLTKELMDSLREDSIAWK